MLYRLGLSLGVSVRKRFAWKREVGAPMGAMRAASMHVASGWSSVQLCPKSLLQAGLGAGRHRGDGGGEMSPSGENLH